jgi:predicted peroxiredoxin
MSKILVHVTCGPENPTKAALGFLVAKAAVEEGHEVSMFLAGDGVQLLGDSLLDKPVELAMPNRLVQLALDADTVITY